MNKLATLLKLIFILNLIQASLVLAKDICSTDQQKDFISKYKKLHSSLDYNGPKGEHKNEDPSYANLDNGHVVEQILFKEYQNSLKKVGLLYSKSLGADSSIKPSNPKLVEFFQSISSNDPKAMDNFISKNQGKAIDSIVEELSIMSSKNFAGKNEEITAQDKYLLKQLLIYAHDYRCRTQWFMEKNEAMLKKYSPAEKKEIERIYNAPLNRMMVALNKVSNDEKIEIKTMPDQDKAIILAVEKNIQDLKDFLNNNKACYAFFKNNPNSIQANIQICNYQKFLDSLINPSISNLEDILHFINANEKHRGITPKLQTGLDENLLSGIIDNTFGNKQVTCDVKKVGKEFEVYIRNLDYDQSTQKFKTDSFVCTYKDGKKGKCDNSLIFTVSIDKGNKVTRAKGSKIVSFSVDGSDTCKDVFSSDKITPQPQDETDETCSKKGKAKTPPEDLVPSEDKKTCVPRKLIKPELDCKKEGETKKPPQELILGPDGKSCVPKKTNDDCKKEGATKNPPENLVLSEDGISCVPFKTEADCKKEGDAKKPPEDLIPSEDKKSCVKRPLKTDADCKKEGEARKPAVVLVLSTDKTKCEEKKDDKEAECKKKQDNYDDEQKKEDKAPRDRFSWDEDKKVCIDRDEKAKGDKSSDSVDEPDSEAKASNQKVPTRQQPQVIPDIQSYVLPGMW